MDSDKKRLGFVNPEKGARHYVTRYLKETKYKEWFERNYPEYEFYDGIGISKEEFDSIAKTITQADAGQNSPESDTGTSVDKTNYAQVDPGQEGAGQDSTVQEGATHVDVKSNSITQAGVNPTDSGADIDITSRADADDNLSAPAGGNDGRNGAESDMPSPNEGSDVSSDDLATRMQGQAVEPDKESFQEQDVSTDRQDVQDKQSARVASGEELAKTVFDTYSDGSYDRRTFEEFVDERILISRDLMGTKEMKIKILEVSDEIQESKIRWKFGDRVKVNKIMVTIKHLDTLVVEEGEFDIAAIEKELAEKRHYSSTNRWIPAGDIKNGYVVSSKHTALISDAVALDYIVF